MRLLLFSGDYLLLLLLRLYAIQLQIGFLLFEANKAENNTANGVNILLPMHFLIHKWIYWRSKVGSVCKLQKHRFFFSGYSIVRNHLFCNWRCFPVFPLDQSANYVL
jgi:hypothetical protein